MPGLSVVGSGEDDERARVQAEREAEHARNCGRYARHLAERAGIDEPAARRVVEVLWSEAAAELRKQHQREARCDHPGALSFCPKCGHRMNAAS